MVVQSKLNIRDQIRLLVFVDQQSGGEWIATKTILAELHNRYSITIDLITWKQGTQSETNSFFASITLLDKPNPNPPFSFLKRLLHKRNLLTQAQNDYINTHSKPDVVLTTDYFAAIVLGKIVRRMGVPLLFSYHGGKSRLRLTLLTINYREIITKFLERMALLVATKIIVPAENGQVRIKRQLGFLLSNQKVHLVPNTIDSHFQKTVTQNEMHLFRQKYHLPRQSRIILYCGRLVSYKGIETLLSAFLKTAQRHKKSVLVLAFPSDSVEPGIKRSIENARHDAQQNGDQDRIILLSDLFVEELNILYRISWTSVLASETEISPLVMYESLAHGTPVIGTRVGDLPQVLGHIDKRLLIFPGSEEQLVEKIDWILSLNQKEYKKLRNLCAKFPLTNPQNAAQKLWSILQDVTQNTASNQVSLLKS